MDLHLMREQPDNSGHYVDVPGAPMFGSLEEVQKAWASGEWEAGRYALRLYEGVRTDAMHQADKDATQAAHAQGLQAAQQAQQQPAAAAQQPPAPVPDPAHPAGTPPAPVPAQPQPAA